MAEIITRKCAKCKGEIVIDVDDIRDVVYFNKLYYHHDCFKDMATEKAASKRGKPQVWKDALDRILYIEKETKDMLESYAARDKLNVWLLENYDVVTIPSYFWQLVAELESGKYRNKRCKPISIQNMCECWKWGQVNLNKIDVNNKTNHKGPTNDTDRLRYDLAILINKYPLFLKHKSKMAAIEAADKTDKKQEKINYGVLSKNNKTDNDNDILDLMDEIF